VLYPRIPEADVPSNHVGVVYLPELLYTDVLVCSSPYDVSCLVFVFDRTSILDNQAALAIGMNNAYMLYQSINTNNSIISIDESINTNHHNFPTPSLILWKLIVKINEATSKCMNKTTYNPTPRAAVYFPCSKFEFQHLYQ
jgi:hypothetical protein